MAGRRNGGTAVRLIAVLAVASTATDSAPIVRVPRGPAPIIDGRIEETEWRGAAVEQTENGLTVRLRHDGQFLFLGVSSTEEGFPSVCLSQADTVRILHASAALGGVAYTNRGGTWSSKDTAFGYGLRNIALTDAAREERKAYLAEYGWVGSTARMGQGRNHELQISLALTGARPRLAVGYYRMAGEGDRVTWPASLAARSEGCAELRLIQGWVVEHPRFEPTLYPELELAR
jgi:hypothetical protein